MPAGYGGGVDETIGATLLARLEAALAARERVVAPESDKIATAVLALCEPTADDLRLVFTKRAADLSNHAGQMSFPGGKAEAGEDAVATALREAAEEIGLVPNAVRPFGMLDDLTTVVSPFVITPVVAELSEPQAWSLAAAEVAEIREYGLRELVERATVRTELWNGREVLFYDIDGETIWGATAWMVRQLLTLLALA